MSIPIVLKDLPQVIRKQRPDGKWVFRWSDQDDKTWYLPGLLPKRFDEAPKERVRAPLQILFNFNNNNRSYVIDARGIKAMSGEPPVSDAEKEIIKNLSAEETATYIELYRKTMSLPYGDPTLEALIDWIDNVVSDKQLRHDLEMTRRNLVSQAATEKFFAENLPNTWCCPTCKRLIAKETLYKYSVCPGCGSAIQQ